MHFAHSIVELSARQYIVFYLRVAVILHRNARFKVTTASTVVYCNCPKTPFYLL